MIGTSHVVVTARAVRIAAMLVVAGLLVGFVAISSFSVRYGSASTGLDNRSNDTELVAAVLEQESAGLVCGDKPVPTHVVLFQPSGSSKVLVLTFDQAIKASSAREGSIRSYCSGP